MGATLAAAAAVTLGVVPAAGATTDASRPSQAVAYQLDAGHSGAVEDPWLQPPLVKRWTVNVGGPASYPLIAEGKVFVTVNGGDGKTLRAYDRRDGRRLWSRAFGGTYSVLNAAYDRGRVFVLNFDGQLTAVDADSGVTVWTRSLPGQHAFFSPPVADAGAVYAVGQGSGGTLYAVDGRTGSLRWTRSVGSPHNSAPAVAGDRVLLPADRSRLEAYRRSDGTPLWNLAGRCCRSGSATPVVADGRAYSGNEVFDLADGSFVDVLDANRVPAVTSTTIATVGPWGLRASEAATGVERWTFRGDGTIDAPPLVVGSTVDVASGAGRLDAVDIRTGTSVWQGSLGGSVVVDDWNATLRTGMGEGEGTLVVPAGGYLVAFTGTERPLTFTFPEFDWTPTPDPEPSPAPAPKPPAAPAPSAPAVTPAPPIAVSPPAPATGTTPVRPSPVTPSRPTPVARVTTLALGSCTLTPGGRCAVRRGSLISGRVVTTGRSVRVLATLVPARGAARTLTATIVGRTWRVRVPRVAPGAYRLVLRAVPSPSGVPTTLAVRLQVRR